MTDQIDDINKTIEKIGNQLENNNPNSNIHCVKSPQTPSYLLVSDIDGTLLKEGKATPGLRVVRQMLQTHAEDVAIVYATGRSFASTHQLITDDILPAPAAIAPFIGTELWFPNFDEPNAAYSAQLQGGWNRDEIVFWATCMFDLELQPAQFQSALKASFYLKKRSKVYDINAFLEAKNIQAKVVYSCGEYLDILPKNAGKANAVKFLAQKWNLHSSNILTCGDSGNDLDMLMAKDTCNVAVGNLESELHKHMDCGRFYTSELPFAAGVLEGATIFDFWPKTESSQTMDSNFSIQKA